MARLNRERLRVACDELCRRDPAFAASLGTYGYPPLWSRAAGFATLVLIILEQQVSLESARAVYRRLESGCGRVTPESVSALGQAGLRASGLTRQKAAYCLDLAERVMRGETSFRRIARADDADAHAMLVDIRGIGSWTANVYLLFVLRRPDVWPPNDIALMKSISEVHALDTVPDNDTSQTMAEAWRPFRAAAARMLWHAYLCRRGRA